MTVQQLNIGWVIVHGVTCVQVAGRTWWHTRAEAEAAMEIAQAAA